MGAFSLAACSGVSSAAPRVLKGTDEGFGGTITAEVTIDGDGKITDLALSGATMSLKDVHGNLIGAVEVAYEAAKPSVIENK
ncbi:MAG TPA: hypothetical protein DF911_03255 [Erysipelotrichaceae bacterium]|uniref:hypothetical protein n=1 Tax=Galactobacillus timonensis TaxID=2041840 RepID=UPI000C837D01|nr:hypothetical protein [Galactobacillus timonensis]HCV55010.1 hypothetical protein [Erysipelotrichaceae bacterium]HCW55860.1 hypothetical protein [Erysipelotrichaceae bacterium]